MKRIVGLDAASQIAAASLDRGEQREAHGKSAISERHAGVVCGFPVEDSIGLCTLVAAEFKARAQVVVARFFRGAAGAQRDADGAGRGIVLVKFFHDLAVLDEK